MEDLSDIRSNFISFFENNDHEVIPSSPLVPINDPTLMFVNAGMVPFKNYFSGTETPNSLKAVSSQKCVRAGGKHNDLDNVGHTARHLTFFEMLGNFSFGDYFKEDAIELAWNLLTKEFNLPEKKLLVTVFNEDTEAINIWKKVSGLSDDKIIKISTDDNFWSMGDEGPCGPCSEIFFDHGDSVEGGPPGSKNEDGDRFVEIWNLVFMQFLQKSNSERVLLPKPSIDTGMGLERISTVLQGKINNFETDLFISLISNIEDKINIKSTPDNIANFRVIADHLRSISFLIADGVLPSNEGRGYVLRRIMRRAMRHSHLLQIKEPILFKLSKFVIDLMRDQYPELIRAEKLIDITLFHEEERFLSTLSKGLKILDEETKKLKSGDKFDGRSAFKLYDTYGFPLDLTEDLLRDKNLKLDKDSFNSAMKKQKEEAKRSWVGSGDKKTDEAWFEVSDISSPTEFLGYTNYESMGKVTAIIKDSKLTNNIKEGDEAILFLNQTPFYAESGGQLGDIGKIISDKVEFEVTDTKKKINNFHAHIGKLKKGNISIEDLLSLKVDIGYRKKITANHSATHLLHETLRRVLGEHVTQKGSKVSAEKLRFDFSHQKALEDKEIAEVESTINQMIGNNSKVDVKILPYDSALKEGALALFGEKYTDEVRVLSMGDDFFSKELCGGTHVDYLKEIVEFKITSQNSVASGVRRVEAMTGQLAKSNLSFLEKISDKTKIEKNKKDSKSKNINISKDVLNGEVIEFGNIKFYFDVVKNLEAKDLRFLTDECKKDLGTGVSCIISDNDEKSSIAIGVTNDISDEFDAVELIKMSAKIMDGKGGGGRSDMALAGANNINKSDEVFDALKEEISKKS